MLDASTVLAYVLDEPGGALVPPLLPTAIISSLNWSEVLQKSVARGVPLIRVHTTLQEAGLRIFPFDADDAERAAALWSLTRRRGLSLADRACLALAERLSAPALTAERGWEGLVPGVEVQSLR